MTHPSSDEFTLNAADAAALDALLEQGGAVALAHEDSDAQGLKGCLSLLDVLPADEAGRRAEGDDALVAATLARVAAACEATSDLTLNPQDGAELDAVIERGGRPAAGSVGSVGSIGAGLGNVLSLLDVMRDAEQQGELLDSDEANEALVQRTLAAVSAQRQRERFAAQVALVGAAPTGRGLSASWRQVAAAAAVFVVGFSLLMPAINRNRDASQRASCANNLATAGMQLGAYAADHQGALPRGPVGDSWIRTGQPDAVTADGRFQSNSAHLYLLIRGDYLAPDYLACAGNEAAATAPKVAGQMDWAVPQAVSYSYQNQHGAGPVRLDLARSGLAVLADKNPRFVAKNGKLEFDATSNENAVSRQHQSAGQNILTLDGAARWNDSPVSQQDADNVWTKSGHQGVYVGNEAPTNVNRDSFLVP
ncbi:MAG: hypothetical protein V3V20_05465 [Algisphaera sp.]